MNLTIDKDDIVTINGKYLIIPTLERRYRLEDKRWGLIAMFESRAHAMLWVENELKRQGHEV